MSDRAGNVVGEAIRYYPYGAMRAGNPGTLPNDYLYTLFDAQIVQRDGLQEQPTIAHNRAVSTSIPSFLAVCVLFWPSAIAKTMRPRKAIC